MKYVFLGAILLIITALGGVGVQEPIRIMVYSRDGSFRRETKQIRRGMITGFLKLQGFEIVGEERVESSGGAKTRREERPARSVKKKIMKNPTTAHYLSVFSFDF